ncbi:YqaA family protein [Fodinicurvata sp. EGI_FJ10296]|uniref:YqaA family protein n=1 Tax=Fodinicurvata sp. EGI_FJ10296 TaxID=3231908 RepID=UPI003454D823
MIRSLYNFTMDLAAHRHAVTALMLIAFVESSVFPIPPDAMLIPMIMAAREKAWKLAALCTIASVAGGIAGYGLGYFLFEAIARQILEFYGYIEQFEAFRLNYNEWGGWIVFIFGVTPFPYKVITLASGATELNPLVFMVASVLSRGLRFFVVAALIWYFGPPIRSFIERRLGLVFLVGCVLLIGGFASLQFMG